MASEHYDPVKAHEYYEAHKKLKGRHSTKGFTDAQKEQFAYAKYMLGQEKKERNASNTAKINATKKQQREQLTSSAKAEIANLRAELKGMDKWRRKQAKSRIESAIASIREVLSGKKASLNESAKAQKAEAKEKSQEKYTADLDAAYEEIKKKGK